ncbi:MAG: hypothetical protein ABMA01_03015 [Chthoniobacteraceae bacterium]
MKKYMLYFPVLVIVIVTALWLRHGSDESVALQTAIATERAKLAPPPPPDDHAAAAAENEARTLMENNAALRAELHRIEEATVSTQTEVLAMQKTLPPSLDTEITESFGRITDMGAEFGQYARLVSGDFEEMQKELKRRGLNEEGDLSGSVVRAFMKFATWAPQISAMEDTPAEIASLQSTALREAFALSDTQTRQADAIIKAHFATMKAAGLTYSSHEAPGWRERRSASLTQLLWQLRPFIPANSKLTSSLTQIVNLGAGIESRTIAPAPGTSEPQMVQDFPRWPAVPWLPAKRTANPRSATSP